MKLRFWVIMFSVMLAAGMGGTAFAFHSGGVADCDGCHTMHGTVSGGGGTVTAGKGSFLLQGTDPSSTCLNCHQNASPGSYHIATPTGNFANGAPVQRTPGGDFGWLMVNYYYTTTGAGANSTTAASELGQDHGHNIVAADFSYIADTNYTTAPGGSMVSTNLACDSCHDPHSPYRRIGTGSGTVVGNGSSTTGGTGTSYPIMASGSYNNSPGNGSTAGGAIPSGLAVGVYRFLAGPGYSTVAAGSIPYPGIPPAVAPATYNQTSPTENTVQVRVAYGDGRGSDPNQTSWSLWCATCHPKFGPTGGNHVHPTDAVMGPGVVGAPVFGNEAANYNAYVMTGNLTGSFTGLAANQGPFTSLVPFVTGSGVFDTVLGPLASNGVSTSLTPTVLTGAVAGQDEVSCLTCHRAHASGFTHMLRWNADNEFLTVANGTTSVWPGYDSGVAGLSTRTSMGRTMAQWQAAYYDRAPTVFAPYQRSLCNKCHARD